MYQEVDQVRGSHTGSFIGTMIGTGKLERVPSETHYELQQDRTKSSLIFARRTDRMNLIAIACMASNFLTLWYGPLRVSICYKRFSISSICRKLGAA